MARYQNRTQAGRRRDQLKPHPTPESEIKAMAVNATAAREGNTDPLLDMVPGFENIPESRAEPEKPEKEAVDVKEKPKPRQKGGG